jgi:uncharacterized protein with HEPN domain
MDKATIRELLKYMDESIVLIQKRFEPIKSSDDFFENDEGLEKLDAISMRLLAIGESLKSIDKRERELLLKVAEKNYWSKVIQTREILTHHYIEIDAETIFAICDEKLDELKENIEKLQALLDD